MSSTNVHVERARQIADALDSPDQERTLHEQFYAEWEAWEAEDATRTMAAFDREIGRGNDYTGRIVRFVTGRARGAESPFGGESRQQARDRSTAKSVISNPEQRKQVIASLPPRQLEEVIATAQDVAVERVRAQRAEHNTTPTVEELMGGDRWDPSESWIDTLVIRVNRNAAEISGHIKKWGLVFGSMPPEEALQWITEAEQKIADVRAAIQERVLDGDRV